MARTEFTNIRNTSGNTVAVTVTSAVAVGKTIVISASSAVASLSLASAADNRPGSTNVYLKDREIFTTGGGCGHQLRCRVTTQLEIGDVITVTYSVAVSRSPVIVGVYDDVIAPHVAGSLGNAAAAAVTSSVLNSGNFTPGVGDLLVGTVNMVSAGRTFTADAGWNQSAKLVTTAGSGDRGVVQVWRYAAAATPQAVSGTFTVGGSALWGIMGEAYALDTGGPERSGRLWLGDTSYPTLLDGVEYPWSVDGVLSK